ncbi:hypothetical protein GYMLUDRAFT_47097 [Collybiopsis luxurians FD-317 M1]|uniref:Uncharacterized protein n=1 Tax=Collybiopsis luxurians FD-317 M1 TaxID=944289 RepID=A0A0D0BN02_9AGAR|nr:hypothetical protein GYMLUDRAFT_47097 [Collybiopsis luxurians FD-317 M1]
MGRPLWSTVYHPPAPKASNKEPEKWNPNHPFDPDSDAFFAYAEAEIPIDEGSGSSSTSSSSLPPLSTDWSFAASAERLNTLTELVAERRRDLLDIMARRRRIEALESIRRTRAAVVDQRPPSVENSGSLDPATTSSTEPTSAAVGPIVSSGRPHSALPGGRLAHLQVDLDSDDDSDMQFSVPDLHRPLRFRTRTESSQESRERLLDFLLAENRDTILEMERQHRSRTLADRQLQRREGSSYSSRRVASSHFSRQGLDYAYSALLHSSQQSRTLGSAVPTHRTSTSQSMSPPELVANSEPETVNDVRRTLANAQARLRRQRRAVEEAVARARSRSFGQPAVMVSP